MTSYGDICSAWRHLEQHRPRQWLGAVSHQAITWTHVDLPNVFRGIHSHESDLQRSAHEIDPSHVFRVYTFKNSSAFLRIQWIHFDERWMASIMGMWPIRNANKSFRVILSLYLSFRFWSRNFPGWWNKNIRVGVVAICIARSTATMVLTIKRSRWTWVNLHRFNH